MVDQAKQVARDQAAYAVRRGKIRRPRFCELCGRDGLLEKHHVSYDQPLKVVWLCRACHRRIDGVKRRGKKYQKRKS